MPDTHVSDFPLATSIESTLRQAEKAGLIASADLATSEAAVLAAIDARAAKLHVSQQPLANATKKAIQKIVDVYGTAGLNAVTGGVLGDVYDLITGSPSPGFSIVG